MLQLVLGLALFWLRMTGLLLNLIILTCHAGVKVCAKITEEMVDNVEEATRKQIKLRLWYRYRDGRVTSIVSMQDIGNNTLSKIV